MTTFDIVTLCPSISSKNKVIGRSLNKKSYFSDQPDTHLK